MLSELLARARSLWRGVRRTGGVDAEMQEEFRLHMELRTEHLVASGVAVDEAARMARVEFGNREHHRQEARQSRGLAAFDALRFSWLDFKLGVRMLVKYPGLTLVGGIAMAFAIAMGAVFFELINQVVSPKLPFANGERVVGVQLWSVARSEPDGRAAYDLSVWRNEARSLENLGAFRGMERNLIVDGEGGVPVKLAEISASAFRVTNTRPLLGRPLMDSDEQPGAPDVVVIGHASWRTLFNGDSNAVGRIVRVGKSPAEVVGVMPAGFGFPFNQDAWVPLRLSDAGGTPLTGPSIRMFGALVPGVTIDQARAELEMLTARIASTSAQTHKDLRPRVMPYARMMSGLSDLQSLGVRALNVALVLLVVLVCGNVALLVFARAAARESEIVVRAALGASRARIVTQLVAEALVLGAVAALVGIAAATFGTRLAVTDAGWARDLPFWITATLSPVTIAYSAVLTVAGSLIVGILPAVKVTHGVASHLRRIGSGGSNLHFGGVWTAVIIVQVAVTVAFPAFVFFLDRDVRQLKAFDVGFPDNQYLSAQVKLDRANESPMQYAVRYRETLSEFEQRLERDPRVLGVAFTNNLPGGYHQYRQIEVDAGGGAPDSGFGHRITSTAVSTDFFDVVGAPVRAGRAFHSGDVAASAPVVIVNTALVHHVFGDRNPIGRRIRYLDSADSAAQLAEGDRGPWYEVVGIASNLGMTTGGDPSFTGAGFYHPLTQGERGVTYAALHMRGVPAVFATPLRRIAADADPDLRLYRVVALSDIHAADMVDGAVLFRVFGVVGGVALLLSLTGIYAVMSFTVARRTREIGIRVALGASRHRVIAAVFARPLAQVCGGLAAGTCLVAVLTRLITGLSLSDTAVVVGYGAVMMIVCLTAGIAPTRRALRIQPTEALKSEV